MKAIDFIKDYDKITSDDKNATYFHANTMYEFAEEYHKAKLNLLTIPVVSESFYCMIGDDTNHLDCTEQCEDCKASK